MHICLILIVLKIFFYYLGNDYIIFCIIKKHLIKIDYFLSKRLQEKKSKKLLLFILILIILI